MTRVARSIWAVLIWLFLVLIPIQFYLAGRGAFELDEKLKSTREDAWAAHAAVGDIIGLVVLLALIAALGGRLPRNLLWHMGALFVLMVIQAFLPGLGDASSTRWIAALHP